MDITIEINCDNTDFQQGRSGVEVAYILNTLANSISHLDLQYVPKPAEIVLRSSNGYTVGKMRLTETA